MASMSASIPPSSDPSCPHLAESMLQGFPSDGENSTSKAYDYYATSFAIPFYSLVYAHLVSSNPVLATPSDGARIRLFRARAVQNMPVVVHLFAPDGGALPFGRSMTYRFATGCFWAAVALDQLEVCYSAGDGYDQLIRDSCRNLLHGVLSKGCYYGISGGSPRRKRCS